MSKTQALEILNITRQTLPFLMITTTFVAIAFTYGHALNPVYGDDPFDIIRLGAYYLP